MKIYKLTNKHTSTHSHEIHLVIVYTKLLDVINSNRNFKHYTSLSSVRYDWNIEEVNGLENGVIYSDCY